MNYTTDELFQRGYKAHCRWESRRKDENECDAESRMERVGNWLKVKIPVAFVEGWLERSDEWRPDDEEST